MKEVEKEIHNTDFLISALTLFYRKIPRRKINKEDGLIILLLNKARIPIVFKYAFFLFFQYIHLIYIIFVLNCPKEQVFAKRYMLANDIRKFNDINKLKLVEPFKFIYKIL